MSQNSCSVFTDKIASIHYTGANNLISRTTNYSWFIFLRNKKETKIKINKKRPHFFFLDNRKAVLWSYLLTMYSTMYIYKIAHKQSPPLIFNESTNQKKLQVRNQKYVIVSRFVCAWFTLTKCILKNKSDKKKSVRKQLKYEIFSFFLVEQNCF